MKSVKIGLQPDLKRANQQFLHPRRLSITVPARVYAQLIEQSNHDGRSVSNLAAFLLKKSLTNGLQQ